MLRRTMDGEQIGQAVQHVVGIQLASNDDGQTAARELVDDRQHTEGTSILRPILDKIIGPDMPGALRPKPDTRPVIQPETAALWVFLWHFQPFPPPDPVDPLKVHPPAFCTQQSPHAPIAIAAIGRGKLDDRRCQRLLIVADARPPALRRTRLTDDAASTALRDSRPGTHMLDTIAAAGRAQYFPSRAFFRISLSSVSSETALRRRSFSRSRSFRRLAWSSFKPP